MPQVNVPRAVLETELTRYLASDSKEPRAAHAGAARHRVLPLFTDFMGCWALDMAGRLVFFAWEVPEALEPVSDDPVDEVGANAALALGSVRFPALAAIRPVAAGGRAAVHDVRWHRGARGSVGPTLR
jgi:hypothetical protein